MPAPYYYDATKYSCNGTSCGQYIGRTYIYSGYSPLALGAFYTSTLTPGVVYQAVSLNLNEPLSTPVDTRAYDGCGAACAASNVPPSVSVTPSPSVTRTPSATPSVTTTPSVTRTPSVTPSFSVSASVSPSPTRTPSVTVTPTVTPTKTPTPTPTPILGLTVNVQYQISSSLPSTLTFATSSIVNTSANNVGFNNGMNYDFSFSVQGGNRSNILSSFSYADFPDILTTNNNIIRTSALYVNQPNPLPNVSGSVSYVIGANTPLTSVGVYVYKNSTLIYNISHTIGNSNSWMLTKTVNFPIGTLYDGDTIKIVLDTAKPFLNPCDLICQYYTPAYAGAYYDSMRVCSWDPVTDTKFVLDSYIRGWSFNYTVSTRETNRLLFTNEKMWKWYAPIPGMNDPRPTQVYFVEFNLTLNPFLATYNRFIIFPLYAPGESPYNNFPYEYYDFVVVNNTTMRVTRYKPYSNIPPKRYEVDISTINPVFTELYDYPSSIFPSIQNALRTVNDDLVVTAQTTAGLNNCIGVIDETSGNVCSLIAPFGTVGSGNTLSNAYASSPFLYDGFYHVTLGSSNFSNGYNPAWPFTIYDPINGSHRPGPTFISPTDYNSGLVSIVSNSSSPCNYFNYNPCNKVSPSPTPTKSPSVSRTPSVTPSVTPSITRTPSATPSITPSVTPTPSK